MGNLSQTVTETGQFVWGTYGKPDCNADWSIYMANLRL
jgi:hypothetical protein